MSKVFVFGIDGMDRELLAKFKDELPNFSRLLNISGDVSLKSVHPPDSHTAWGSIYTGMNPAEHGIVDFVDPLEKSKILSSVELDNSSIRGKTFWDVASNNGKKVCIILPHLGYPSWKVNGVMIGRSTVGDDFSTYPESLKNDYDLSGLIGLKGFPSKSELDTYILKAKKIMHNEFEFTKKIMHDYEWDLCFTYSSTLDWISHYFRDYYENGDVKYKNTILEFYKEHDYLLGEYLKEINLEETIVLVLSDHGHGLRPLKVVNINDILRQKGYLVSNIKSKTISDPIYIFEKVKKELTKNIVKFNLGNTAQKFLVLVPSARKVYTNPLSIDVSNSIAYISDLSGMKAYSYGGIRIIKENLKSLDYEMVREDISKELMSLKDPTTNKKIAKWVKKREELYNGPNINKYPDLIFDLDDFYGAGWSLYDGLITNAPISNLVPGSHKIDTAILLSSEYLPQSNYTLMDVYELITNLFNE